VLRLTDLVSFALPEKLRNRDKEVDTNWLGGLQDVLVGLFRLVRSHCVLKVSTAVVKEELLWHRIVLPPAVAFLFDVGASDRHSILHRARLLLAIDLRWPCLWLVYSRHKLSSKVHFTIVRSVYFNDVSIQSANSTEVIQSTIRISRVASVSSDGYWYKTIWSDWV